MQQDAEEAWTQLLFCLRKLPPVTEAPQEPKTTTTESFEKLSCHITDTTSFLYDALKHSLEEEISKFSPSLNREAKYRKILRIQKLPFYLTIQFVRFFWKRQTKVKTKILRVRILIIDDYLLSLSLSLSLSVHTLLVLL
jgi:ubiquitin carboxyl-terminal hydrolase 14